MTNNAFCSGRQAANITTFKDRDAWIRAVTADRRLSPSARLIAARVALHLNVETGRCDPAMGTLAEEVGMHRASAFRAVAALAAQGWIEVAGTKGRHTNSFRLILPTVAPVRPLNRGTSATVGSPNDRTNATATVASARVEPSHQCDPISEEKTEGENRNIYPSTLPLTEVQAEKSRPTKPKERRTRFDEFYNAFPRHVARGAAVKAYARIIKSGKATEQELIDGAKRYAAERLGKQVEFTKHPATWLNAECWKDEPASPETRSSAGPQNVAEQALNGASRAWEAFLAADEAEMLQ